MRFAIEASADVVASRQRGKQMAQELGFSSAEATMIATAISEVARNILIYAGTGEVELETADENGRRGLRVVASDQGPGIDDVERALQDGFSTGKGLGLGLPGARRLMDDLELETHPGRGTTVRMVKWVQ